jgi:phosphorylase/glycogen(starch) synthase
MTALEPGPANDGGASTPEDLALFEVAWEICHPIGGVHTVIRSRTASRVASLGGDFVCVGPWRLAEPPQAFSDDPAEADFAEGCRAAGLPVRVGTWDVPGRPRTILVESSGLIPAKDGLLGTLWEKHKVDSLAAGWDYVEPVLFGIAAGRVIERWYAERMSARRKRAVIHAHEWSAAAAVLHAVDAMPSMGTVFQAHSTVLGSALARAGREPATAFEGQTPAQVAEALGVRAQHSLEGAAARAADVFTTVSEPAADEGALIHGRRPEPLLPNVLDTTSFGADPAAKGSLGPSRAEARKRVREVLGRLLGRGAASSRLLITAGRSDLRVKGFDVLLDALATLDKVPGPPVTALFIVAAPAAGVAPEVLARLKGTPASAAGAVFSTHALFEPEEDPLFVRARGLGLVGGPADRRVRVLHVPVYVDGKDGVFDLPYASLLQAADLTCYPSAYETWGFTPQESLALGVPTITSDVAGFARFLARHGLVDGEAVTVLARQGRPDADVVRDLAAALERGLARGAPDAALVEHCRAVSGGVLASELVAAQASIFREALAGAGRRAQAQASPPRATLRIERPSGDAPRRPNLLPLDVPSRLPDALAPLLTLAWNWRWAWHGATRALFEELDPERYAAERGNPLAVVRGARQERLDRLASDAGYLARVKAAATRHAAWMAEAPALAETNAIPLDRPVAYICAEYALHECFPIYSGGLGVLAGDHLRAASDLGLPLVAVGLLYRRGYFRQHLEGGLEQVSEPDPVDPERLPLEPVEEPGGTRLEIRLPLPGGTLLLTAWKAQVGRVPLYLLDADHPSNRPEDRAVTHTLYGGDAETRLRQELVLGRGGVRLLHQLGLRPSVLHVNEGHGAFAALERIALLVRETGLSFDEARLFVRLTTSFTTHTPVPAGHDRFDEDLLRRYMSDAPTWLGIPWERFLRLGSVPSEPRVFNMTTLAVKLSGQVNGVSERHAAVSRPLLKPQAPHLLTPEVPVYGITNGVHLETWTAPEVVELLGPPVARLDGARFAGAAKLDLAALHEARRALKQRLIERMRAQLERELTARGDPAWLAQQTLAGLTPKALWIGFARRFATYKRAGLLLSQPERLRALLESAQRPVRIVLAGKAHPRDKEGQELIGRIARLARSKVFAGKLFFLEGYDLELARHLVQGVDVWLNTPRPPHEASGTSGMKAAANGGLNASTPDGWWLEAHDGKNGWMIGEDVHDADEAIRDRADVEALYRLLEEEIVPLWERRDEHGVPRAWLERARHALCTIPPRFDALRMVEEYRVRAYEPQARRRLSLEASSHAAVRSLAAERRRIRDGMAQVRVVELRVGDPGVLRAGDAFEVEARVALGALDPADVHVELVLGERGSDLSDLDAPQTLRLAPNGTASDGVRSFTGRVLLRSAGRLAYGVRVRPRSEDVGLSALHEPAVWA